VQSAKRRLVLSLKHAPAAAAWHAAHAQHQKQQASASATESAKKKGGAKKSTASAAAAFPAVESIFAASLGVGRTVPALVTKLDAGRGLLLRVAPDEVARVHVTDLIADRVRLRPVRRFAVGQLVRARVDEVCAAAARRAQVDDDDDDDSAAKSKSKKKAAEAERVERWASICHDDDEDQEDQDAEDAESSAKPPRVASFAHVKEGSVVVGFVKAATMRGVFVALSRAVTAFVRVSDLTDGFVKDVVAAYPVGALVIGRVTAVNAAQQQCQLSLKKSVVLPASAALKFSDLVVGRFVTCAVRRVETYGVFCALERSLVTGMCHRSEITDDAAVALKEYYAVGDRVRAQVLKLDEVKRRVSLGMKAEYLAADPGASDDEDADEDEDEAAKEAARRKRMTPEERFAERVYVLLDKEAQRVALKAKNLAAGKIVFDDEDEEEEEEEESADESEEEDESDDEDEDDEDEDAESDDEVDDQEEEASDDDDEDDEDAAESDDDENENETDQMNVDDDDDDEDEDDVPELSVDLRATASSAKSPAKPSAAAAASAKKAAAPVSVSLLPHRDSSDDDDSASDDDDDESSGSARKKKSSAAKKAEKRRLERATREREDMLVDEERAPESADDFDRLLLASPHNSFLWIKYMEFYISITEIDRARQVAERALQTIALREEQEKFNIWIAYLNVENMYGSAESLKKVFARAVQYCDAERVYFQMAHIYEQTKPDQAEECYAQMTKRFKHNPKVWLQFALFRHSKRDMTGARALLQRALTVLEKPAHIDLIAKFAVMEFKHGEAEHGRTLLESIVANYPKRTDIWSVYLDQELKINNKPIVRYVFSSSIDVSIVYACFY
jgi:rRNA biogenesis protein RRP5